MSLPIIVGNPTQRGPSPLQSPSLLSSSLSSSLGSGKVSSIANVLNTGMLDFEALADELDDGVNQLLQNHTNPNPSP
jgi:hypothetical protein